jgi:hypothetical protein
VCRKEEPRSAQAFSQYVDGAVKPDSQTLLDSYEEERRLVAADMLGLATKLLDAAKRGEMRRG